jgi:flagellar basal body-associated protein FliL
MKTAYNNDIAARILRNAMKVHSKANNFIAILIALLLFAAGFIMYFIHLETHEGNGKKPAKSAFETSLDAAYYSDKS